MKTKMIYRHQCNMQSLWHSRHYQRKISFSNRIIACDIPLIFDDYDCKYNVVSAVYDTKDYLRMVSRRRWYEQINYNNPDEPVKNEWTHQYYTCNGNPRIYIP